jgi:hypothetical protein
MTWGKVGRGIGRMMAEEEGRVSVRQAADEQTQRMLVIHNRSTCPAVCMLARARKRRKGET